MLHIIVKPTRDVPAIYQGNEPDDDVWGTSMAFQRPSYVPVDAWAMMTPANRRELLSSIHSNEPLQPHNADTDGPHEAYPDLSRMNLGSQAFVPPPKPVIDPSLLGIGHPQTPRQNFRTAVAPQTPLGARQQPRSFSQPVPDPAPLPRIPEHRPPILPPPFMYPLATDPLAGLHALCVQVLTGQQEIRAELADIKRTLQEVQAPIRQSRGEAVIRGTARKMKVATSRRRQRHVTPPDENDEFQFEGIEADCVTELEAFTPNTVEPAHAEVVPEDLKLSKSELSDAAYAARLRLQALCTSKFREITGVREDMPWPNSAYPPRINPTTKEEYYTPNFLEMVDYSTNDSLLRAIAEHVYADLQLLDPDDPLRHPRYIWDQDTLHHLSKTSFRSFKQQFRDQTPTRAATKAANQRVNRRAERRKTKAQQCNRACGIYEERHGCNPRELLYADYMSDEASGPEDTSDESLADWKARMIHHAGLENVSPDILNTYTIREVIEPEWRSQQLSDILAELRDISKTLKDSSKRTSRHAPVPTSTIIQVRGTGRTTSEPPLETPYNLGINLNWWNTHKDNPKFKHMLEGWWTWPSPVGFDDVPLPSDLRLEVVSSNSDDDDF